MLYIIAYLLEFYIVTIRFCINRLLSYYLSLMFCISVQFTDTDYLPFSSPVAVWVGCFPETGCAEARGSRLCVCSCTHISWQNSGGRVRHRSLTEAHDKVCVCWYKLIFSALTMRVGVQLCRELNTLLLKVEISLVFELQKLYLSILQYLLH